MVATLTGSSGQTPLGATILAVGRAPDNQLVIHDPQISGHHAEILPAGQGYNIVDLGSTNGTFVNDSQLTPNTQRSLHPGDRIRFGKNSVFTYGVSGVPQVNPTLHSSAGAQLGYPSLQPSQYVSPLPKRRWLTLGNIKIGGGIGIIVAVIGLLLQLGVIHPISPKVIPTATPNLSSFRDARMICQSDNTIDPKTLWRYDGNKSTTFNCNATGMVITQKPNADATASIGLPLPLPHVSLTRNYSISVQISNLALPQSCAGVIFRHSGYRAYLVEFCLNGIWSVAKSFATNGVVDIINHGTYTVNQKNSYLFLVEVSNEVATISINGQGLPPVTLDPTFTDKTIDLSVDGSDPEIAVLDPSTNPGASVTFSQFIFQPLS